MFDPYAASRSAGERIEALYGRPVGELAAEAETDPLLYTLLDSFDTLRKADRAIPFYAEQLHSRTGPECAVTDTDAGHVVDAARRLAQAVTVRDANARLLGNLLRSLRRVPAAEPDPPQALSPAVPPPAPASAVARSR
ncbi:hypothetical protein ACGFRB_23540 [Streptomyces sp. NPDC048718]|uniref:hypothetical protein n=1 Tax=Streptomyces sp. NPDC048718 TaxID=3365587 RepID=UPI0037180C8D